MAPRKNTKSASTPAPVAASKTAKVPAGRKNTKPASTSAPVAASKTAKVPATRKNIKSASTPAPVADSETAKVYSGRKTRAMIAAEEKAAAEAGNTAVDANIAATQSVKTVKPAATKPAAIKTETAGPAKPAQPVKAAIIKAKTVEPVKLAQPVKANTLKSASNALKALKGAAKTNQDGTNLTTGASTTKPAATKPTTVTPGATKDTIAKPATTTATRATATTATKARTPQATMSMAQAAELIKLFRCFQPSAKTSAVNAHVSKKHGVKKHGVKKPVVKEPVDPAMIPVYSGQPPQAVVDAELTKWLTADKKKPTPWGTQVEPICPENMANDFEAMGFSSDKVKELVVMKEPVKVDGLAQMVNLKTGAGSFVPGTGPEPPKRVRRAAKYHDLILFEDKDWVLFDPLKPYPVEHGEPPYSINRWATFVPGNARVLVMNMKTKSIRSQATPEALRNQAVDYTPSGPKIVDWTPIKNPNKKASSSMPAAAPPAPPLLGRGAKRNAARVIVSEAPPPAPSAPAVKKTSIKRKADEISAAEPPPPAPSAPALKKTNTSAPKRKASEISASEPPPPAAPSVPVIVETPPSPAAKKRKTGPKKASTTTSTTSAPKKRKADEISAAPAPAVPASAPVAAPPAPKKRKTKGAALTAFIAALPSPLSRAAAVVPAAPVVAPPPAPVAPLAGVKRKRRATRPKKTPAVVENSSSE